MKILRLNEASSKEILDAKEAFNETTDKEERLTILDDFLRRCGLNDDPRKRLESFGIDFLSDWMNSFKWEEAGRTDNEFIAALNNTASPIFTQSKDRFIKAYNAYASNYINSIDELDYNPIYNDSLYKYSGDDIKRIINYWSQAYNKFGNKKDLIELFYERTSNNWNDFSTKWRVRTAAEIEKRIRDFRSSKSNNNESEITIDSENDENQLNNLLRKNNHNRQFAAELLNTLNNEAGNI